MRPSTQRLLSMFLSLVLILIFSYMTFNNNLPKWRDIQKLRETVSEKEAVRSQVEKIRAGVQDFLARFTDIDRQALPIHQALPLTPNFHEVLAIIAAISAKHQISFSRIDFDVEQQFRENREAVPARTGRIAFRTPPQSFRVSMIAVGEYPNFRRWLADIETERRLLDLSSLTLRTFGDNPDEKRLIYDIRFTAYFQPPIEAAFEF